MDYLQPEHKNLIATVTNMYPESQTPALSSGHPERNFTDNADPGGQQMTNIGEKKRPIFNPVAPHFWQSPIPITWGTVVRLSKA